MANVTLTTNFREYPASWDAERAILESILEARDEEIARLKLELRAAHIITGASIGAIIGATWGALLR